MLKRSISSIGSGLAYRRWPQQMPYSARVTTPCLARPPTSTASDVPAPLASRAAGCPQSPPPPCTPRIPGTTTRSPSSSSGMASPGRHFSWKESEQLLQTKSHLARHLWPEHLWRMVWFTPLLDPLPSSSSSPDSGRARFRPLRAWASGLGSAGLPRREQRLLLLLRPNSEHAWHCCSNRAGAGAGAGAARRAG